MKYTAVLCLLVLFTCGCNRNEARTELLSEQKTLKDSTNNINDRIGGYIQKGISDSAEAERKQLGAVYARLTAIQASMDSLDKIKQ